MLIRFRVDRRARIFEIMSQSLTIAPNVHTSGTSSMSSPAWWCWRCQTVIQLQKALSGSDHKSQKMSEDRLIKARMAITQVTAFEHSLPRTIFTVNTSHPPTPPLRYPPTHPLLTLLPSYPLTSES